MVSKFQLKPFWLATQRDPQNDWTATQNRVNYDVFAQAPSWSAFLAWISCGRSYSAPHGRGFGLVLGLVLGLVQPVAIKRKFLTSSFHPTDDGVDLRNVLEPQQQLYSILCRSDATGLKFNKVHRLFLIPAVRKQMLEIVNWSKRNRKSTTTNLQRIFQNWKQEMKSG